MEYTPQQITALAEPLFQAMSLRCSPEEMALIHKAFDVAREAHAPQRRKSGEPYIIHPIAVARIVGEELELGANPVCAAFLHDVVEDTPTTSEQIEEMFGPDIAFLVRTVTKTKKQKYETSKQVDNFRQMLNSINHDIRALLLKLADRLHNMRTLHSMPAAKQMKIAGETDYFYAPLANRLGLYSVKTELENLSFRYRCPVEYAYLERRLEEERQSIGKYLEDFRSRVITRLEQGGVQAVVNIVTRRPYSIRRKMLKTNTDFDHLERMHNIDLVYDCPSGATRHDEKELALHIYSLLTDEFEERPHSLSNYIDHPKENGYQAMHVHLLADNGHWQEVHICSRRMRRVQLLGCIADHQEGNIANWIAKLRSTLSDMAANSREVDFMEGVVTTFYSDDVAVYTPEGTCHILPTGATALDFAYELSTDTGRHAHYARINGRLAPVETPVHRGDIAEIGTSAEAHPTHEQLRNVVTYKAISHIVEYLHAQPVPLKLRCNHCNPLPGDEVIGFRLDDGKTEIHRPDCEVAIRQAAQQGDKVVAVTFPESEEYYPVSLQLRAIDRNHLLAEIIDCISNRLELPIVSVETHTDLAISDIYLTFKVRSYGHLRTALRSLNAIASIEEIKSLRR